MAWGLNSLLHIGNGALFASQASTQTTANNISNVDTEGYSRQRVVLKERYAIDSRPGQIGMGVDATEVQRYFDRFVESAYLDKATLKRRYEEEYSLLRSVENVFNESITGGISKVLGEFYNSWSKLAQDPNNLAIRSALLEKAQTLSSALANADKTLVGLEEQMDGMINQEVTKANTLIQQIAGLNKEINAHTQAGRNNANATLDERDRKVRELANILDIKVQDRGDGSFNVTTGAGLLLVQDSIAFGLSFKGPQVEKNLVYDSKYDGTVSFSGKDGYEYTIEVVAPGTIDSSGNLTPAAGTAQYRVSTDGGKTWLKNDDGSDQLFYATSENASAHVKNLDIYFTGTTELSTGDKFVISPKSDVYWQTTTGGDINISTQVYTDGNDNNLRITGGTLGGYLEFRDSKIGIYRDQLEAFTKTLAWEVNRIHSQGAGLTPLTSLLGEDITARTDIPLGSRSSGNPWFNRLQSGNMTFAIYDATTGKPVLNPPSIDVFSPDNFDPSKHSLEDVVNAINSGPAGAYLKGTIVDNRLQIVANSGYSFGVTADTSGLAAALGCNTFFSGSSAASIGVRTDLLANNNLINAGRANGAGEGNKGDNQIAKEISALANKEVDILVSGQKKTRQTMTEFWASIVTKVGADTSSVKFTAVAEGTMAQELYNRREEISGINLDEEMSNLIRFQSSYKAAAKLITTADQMFQTILGMKN